LQELYSIISDVPLFEPFDASSLETFIAGYVVQLIPIWLLLFFLQIN
jgi:hypothetical protein